MHRFTKSKTGLFVDVYSGLFDFSLLASLLASKGGAFADAANDVERKAGRFSKLFLCAAR